MIGHLLGASGAVEAVATVQVNDSFKSIRHHYIKHERNLCIKTINFLWMRKEVEWTKHLTLCDILTPTGNKDRMGSSKYQPRESRQRSGMTDINL